jgi:hypothetical protein
MFLHRVSVLGLMGLLVGLNGTAHALGLTGSWQLSQPISYTCATGVISHNYTSLAIVDTDPTIEVDPLPASLPGPLTGSFSNATDFSVSTSIAGTCTETYTLTATVVDPTTITGTYTMSFAGSCFDCTLQQFAVTATRPDAVPSLPGVWTPLALLLALVGGTVLLRSRATTGR